MDTKKTSSKTIIVSCPTCQKTVIWCDKEVFKPFCSERCKLIDLGEWAAEKRVIPGQQIH